MLVAAGAFAALFELVAAPDELHATLRPATGYFEYMIRRNLGIESTVCRMRAGENSLFFEKVDEPILHIAIIIDSRVNGNRNLGASTYAKRCTSELWLLNCLDFGFSRINLYVVSNEVSRNIRCC
jgi:hypothetical protein